MLGSARLADWPDWRTGRECGDKRIVLWVCWSVWYGPVWSGCGGAGKARPLICPWCMPIKVGRPEDESTRMRETQTKRASVQAPQRRRA